MVCSKRCSDFSPRNVPHFATRVGDMGIGGSGRSKYFAFNAIGNKESAMSKIHSRGVLES